jgi:hypothetical protein
MRLPTAIHTRDRIQLAINNEQTQGSAVRFCLIPPVDDFGADRALEQCEWADWVDRGRRDRQTFTYLGRTGQAFLVVQRNCSSCIYSWAVTLERITTWVGIGWARRTSVRRGSTLTAFARYGDNSAVANGTRVTLQWKVSGAPRRAWRVISRAQTVNGAARLRASLPGSAAGRRVDLAACAAGPAPCAVDGQARVRFRRHPPVTPPEYGHRPCTLRGSVGASAGVVPLAA